jgi:hypothetical protein
VARRVLPDLPLVFTSSVADPFALGLAESYTRPGGMATGNVMNAIGGEETITEKRIGLFTRLESARTGRQIRINAEFGPPRSYVRFTRIPSDAYRSTWSPHPP